MVSDIHANNKPGESFTELKIRSATNVTKPLRRSLVSRNICSTIQDNTLTSVVFVEKGTIMGTTTDNI